MRRKVVPYGTTKTKSLGWVVADTRRCNTMRKWCNFWYNETLRKPLNLTVLDNSFKKNKITKNIKLIKKDVSKPFNIKNSAIPLQIITAKFYSLFTPWVRNAAIKGEQLVASPARVTRDF